MIIQGRKKPIENLAKQLNYYQSVEKRTRNDCRIPVMAAAPGLGKTKLLLELNKLDQFKDHRVIIMTYNNGHKPTSFAFDFPEAGSALRFLYFGFESHKFESFQSYFDQMAQEFGDILNDLNLATVLSMLPDCKLTILGVDEFNYLLRDQYFNNPILYRSTSKQIVIELGNSMVTSSSRLFPILAGTAMNPLSIISESSHPCYQVPFELLKLEDLVKIAYSLQWLPIDWKTSGVFHRALSSTGGVPRIVEFFFIQCKKQITSEISIENWPWISMINEIKKEAKARYLIASRTYARVLLVDAVLERTVERNQLIFGDDQMTYGELEKTGNIFLTHFDESNGELRIQIPFLLFSDPSW